MAAELALFDIERNVLRPTVHCHALVVLKTIMDTYPEHLEVYKYLYYMCSHSPKNPFLDADEDQKEALIFTQVSPEGWSTEDDEVQAGLALCRILFTTPTSRAYIGFKILMDRISDFMTNTTSITTGRDGNLTALISAGKNFDGLRNSFKGTYKDLMDEQSSTARGGVRKAYDQ